MFQKLGIILLSVVLLVSCGKKEEAKTDNPVKTGNNFRFTYDVSLPDVKENLSEVELLIPVPQDNNFQKIENITINTNGKYEFGDEYHFGNKYILVTFDDTLSTVPIAKLTVDVTRMENSNLTSKKFIQPEDSIVLADCLLPDSLVPIDGQVAAEAQKVIKDGMTDLEKAKAMYDYLQSTMSYDKSGEGWGRGDAIYACDIRKGNCTDFHSLFIGMARSQGIPAKFSIGFPLPLNKQEGTIGGYHCWAEFYVDGYGWIPVDISEAAKDTTKREYFFGNLDDSRVTFTVGRDLELDTYKETKSLNFFIYPQVYLNGNEYKGYTKAFSFVKI
ncbi:MAG: transglutaminase domain-containing protein [Calditrichaeota bacterium]|nr:MAG: transglutaminase domain-containing protein [Calditrichota bacterium]